VLDVVLDRVECREKLLVHHVRNDEMEVNNTDYKELMMSRSSYTDGRLSRSLRNCASGTGLRILNVGGAFVTGAIEILSNIKTMDWVALYAGRICLDEVARVRRLVRRDIISLPRFMSDLGQYCKILTDIARINGLLAPDDITVPATLTSTTLVRSNGTTNNKEKQARTGSRSASRRAQSSRCIILPGINGTTTRLVPSYGALVVTDPPTDVEPLTSLPSV